MDRGVCQATVHGVAKNQTQLSDWAHTHTHSIAFIPILRMRNLNLEDQATHSRPCSWRMEPGSEPRMGFMSLDHWTTLLPAKAMVVGESETHPRPWQQETRKYWLKPYGKWTQLVIPFFKIFLMGTILSSLLHLLQCCFSFMFWFFGPQGKWDLSSPTRDRTSIPCNGRGCLIH